MILEHMVWLVGALSGLAAEMVRLVYHAMRVNGDSILGRFRTTLRSRGATIVFGSGIVGLITGLFASLPFSADHIHPIPLWAVAGFSLSVTLLLWRTKSPDAETLGNVSSKP